MHRPLTPLRAVTFGGLIVLVLVSAAGCGTAAVSDEPTGWAILSSTADAEVLPLDLTGDAELTGDALALDGVTGSGSTAAPADLDITKSFTVAAWVTSQGGGPFQAAVSQIGTVAGGFFLGASDGVPSFSMKDADTNAPGHTIRAEATGPLERGTWKHLAGVFDVDKGEIVLYVDGVKSASTAFDAPWRPVGLLTVGRSQAHGVPADHWAGAITEVRLLPTASTQSDVESLMAATRPEGTPPELPPPAPSTYAGGRLEGTWDSLLTPEEAAILGPIPLGTPTAIRLGFSGATWWQGFVVGDEVWLVSGVPEGDGGVFSTDGNTIVLTNPAGAVVTYDLSVDGDELTLVLTDCLDQGAPCTDVDVVRFVTERVWTFRSSDPSFG